MTSSDSFPQPDLYRVQGRYRTSNPPGYSGLDDVEVPLAHVYDMCRCVTWVGPEVVCVRRPGMGTPGLRGSLKVDRMVLCILWECGGSSSPLLRERESVRQRTPTTVVFPQLTVGVTVHREGTEGK